MFFILDKIDELVVDEELVEKYVQAHLRSARATELGMLSLDVASGKKTFEELEEFCQDNIVNIKEDEVTEESNLVSDDLEELLSSSTAEGGIYWPLRILNRAFGPLRKGDFGFVFARPETGKTTFLAHCVSHFATQVDRPILWFNNEEQGSKVKLRVFQAFFGVDIDRLQAEREKFSSVYKEKIGGKVLIYDSPAITKKDVERMCKEINPSVIIFDQIDKIKGFANDRYDLELKQVYQWARELAKQYGPCIGVCQAGGSGEGKKFLTMDDVDSSKTAKQGEADWILGIGSSHQEGYESLRHFAISKNKLMGDDKTDANLRHGKFDVRINPLIARYEDVS